LKVAIDSTNDSGSNNCLVPNSL